VTFLTTALELIALAAPTICFHATEFANYGSRATLFMRISCEPKTPLSNR
jgi:hypothetical protein